MSTDSFETVSSTVSPLIDMEKETEISMYLTTGAPRNNETARRKAQPSST